MNFIVTLQRPRPQIILTMRRYLRSARGSYLLKVRNTLESLNLDWNIGSSRQNIFVHILTLLGPGGGCWSLPLQFLRKFWRRHLNDMFIFFDFS